MQRNIEPVSPVGPQQQQVITIDDDDDNTPQQAPLRGEPPFEVLSMSNDTPAPPEPAPEPEQRPPEPAPEPEPALEPAPESPQPGPSGIQEESDDNDNYEEYSGYYLSKSDESVGTLTRDNMEYMNAKPVITKAKKGLTVIHLMLEHFQDTVTMQNDYKEAYRVSRRVHKRKLEQYNEIQVETKKFKDAAEASDKKVKEARDENVLLQRQCKEAHDANGMLHRQLEVERLEAIDYKEQRDQAEIAIDELKAKLAQEKLKVYNLKKYNNALKGTLADKDASIARLETELTQTRQRLHQFTRIKVQQRPAYRQQGAAAVQYSSSSSSEEEDNN